MPKKFQPDFSAQTFIEELEEHREKIGDLLGWMFERLVLYVDEYTTAESKENSYPSPGEVPDLSNLRVKQAVNTARFAGAKVVHDIEDETITHVVVGKDRDRIKALRKQTSG